MRIPRPPRPPVLLLLALLLPAPLPLACAGGEQGPPARTAAAERGRLERVVVATGTVEPKKEVEVRPRIAGIVERIRVSPGDSVEPGQVLVEIERDLLAPQVHEARAALDAARVEARFARIELDRLIELQSRGASSSRELDSARARHEKSLAEVARAEATLERLSAQLEHATVRSSLAGRVLDVVVEEGSAVAPVTATTGGTLLLSLAATDVLHLKGLVDENEIARVEVGQPARIRTEAYGERRFEGRVREIAPVGERIQNVTYFEVEIEVTDPESALLRPRMSGDAEIVTEVIEDALVIPETALRYAGNEIYVEAWNGSGAGPPERRVVEIGVVDGDRVQVVDGLAVGEEVVLQ